MRLREIANVLYECSENMDFEVREIPPNFGLSNFRLIFAAAAAIHDTGALKAETEALLAMTEIARHVDEEVFVSRERYSHFNNLVHQIKVRSELLGMTISNMLPPEKADQVAVKLPEDADLQVIGAVLLELNKALTLLVVNAYIKGDVRLIEFDRGSNWLEISLASLAAVQVMASVLRLIYDVRLKEIEVATRRELFRNLRIKTDAAAAIEEALEEEVRSLRETRILDIASVAKIPEADHEARKRLEHSISLLSDLVNKGVEVHPSVMTPVEIRDVYPNPKQLTAVVKQLLGASQPQLEASSQ
jgi:hypothetical protein